MFSVYNRYTDTAGNLHFADCYEKCGKEHIVRVDGGAEMSELKPCPFCGNHADLDFHANGCKQYFDDMGVSYNTPTLYTVKCRWCGCLIGAYESTDGAIEAWNRRAET